MDHIVCATTTGFILSYSMPYFEQFKYIKASTNLVEVNSVLVCPDWWFLLVSANGIKIITDPI